MPDTTETGIDGRQDHGVGPADAALEAWFMREVWPLEAILMQYLRQNWRDRSAAEDLLHDVYVRVYEAARTRLPDHPKAFIFTTARNLLISRVRQRNVVPIEAAVDFEAIGLAIDTPGPEQITIARDELRRLEAAINRLPPQCRKVVMMRRIEGLSRPEIALRLGIAESTVSSYLENGMSVLADVLYGSHEPGVSTP
ncbi:MAG TPA: sigma-70 family RNA polymerase sigma factor [Rhizomicrobium sp.]